MATKKASLALAALILVACGDSTTENVTNVNQMGVDVVKSAKDLPECTEENDGELAFVKGESAARVCVDGEWSAPSVPDTVYVKGGKDTVYVKDDDFSCTTKELADKSGLKIICNGDSIGVVQNGAKGDKGDDGHNGAGCSLTGKTDTTVTVTCGDSTMVVELGRTTDVSSEDDTSTIDLESLEGYTQKGPFLKGSSVYLYELNGSLNQTNGNFTSVITSDDGRYRFRTRNVKGPYAMVVVDGYYRNEVTGKTSDAPIRLRAITDVSSRVTGSANVNLLTHLEYDRVISLATGVGRVKVKEAKHKAQTEILDAFHFDTNLVKNVQSEDMDVFGKGEADAALLAVSLLLQGDGSASDLSVLLTELADDLVDGKWDGENASSIKAALADSALSKDIQGKLATYRSNVAGWGLGGGNVPDFEKYIRRFASIESGLGLCGSDSARVGTVKHMSDPRSRYYVSGYMDTDAIGGTTRFTCVDDAGVRWRAAMNIEKDTMGWGAGDNDGEVRRGQINKNAYYVYQASEGIWRSNTVNFPGMGYSVKSFDDGYSSITWKPQELEIGEAFEDHGVFESTFIDGADYPYAGITLEFDSPGDISSWNGICVTYSSTIGFSIGVMPSEVSSAYYTAFVDKSAKVQSISLPWTDFNKFSGEGDLATNLGQATGFNLDFEGNGKLTIWSIGPLGSCLEVE